MKKKKQAKILKPKEIWYISALKEGNSMWLLLKEKVRERQAIKLREYAWQITRIRFLVLVLLTFWVR